MTKISIKKATISDLQTLLAFEQGIIFAEKPLDETLRQGQISYYNLQEMISEQDTEVAIAIIDNEIVGSGYAKIIQAKDYYDFQEYAYLGFMFTKPEYRGQGINMEIIEYLKEWCLSKNIIEIRLDVYDTNISAIKSYEKSGFKKDMVNMRVRLK